MIFRACILLIVSGLPCQLNLEKFTSSHHLTQQQVNFCFKNNSRASHSISHRVTNFKLEKMPLIVLDHFPALFKQNLCQYFKLLFVYNLNIQ